MEINQADFHIPTATTTTTRRINLVKTRLLWDTHSEGKVNSAASHLIDFILLLAPQVGLYYLLFSYV